MKESKKRAKLDRRIAAWRQLATTLRDDGPHKRYASGGYRCPGSVKGS